MLRRLYLARLKVNVRKCQFLKKSLEYLGHVVTAEGIMMQEGKIKSICEYPTPTNVKGIRRFLGMVGYYHPFIKNFASIAKPLTELTKRDKQFEWSDNEQLVFETLRIN